MTQSFHTLVGLHFGPCIFTNHLKEHGFVYSELNPASSLSISIDNSFRSTEHGMLFIGSHLSDSVTIALQAQCNWNLFDAVCS
jgi:hypothetical protein